MSHQGRKLGRDCEQVAAGGQDCAGLLPGGGDLLTPFVVEVLQVLLVEPV
jgi:hypothetical protein